GEQPGRRRSLGAQPLLCRQAQCANTGENLQPRQEQPTCSPRNTPPHASGNKIKCQKRRDQGPQRTQLFRERGLKTPQRDAEDSDAQGEEKSEQHYGSIRCSSKNFSSCSPAKFASPSSPATSVGT